MKFNFYTTPKIIFGAKKIHELSSIASGYGRTVLVVTGSRSFKRSGVFERIITDFNQRMIEYYHLEISGEPSPEQIDKAVALYRSKKIEVVIGIGGGSAIDAGKTISAMLTVGDSVLNYLEGIGTKKHTGQKVPFLAVPTTAGTGSEASANAVLSTVGANGYKRSIRHDNFCPDVALVDPELAISCPSDVTASCGMDALTQLIESYVSDKASPFTDALVESALPKVRGSLATTVSAGNDLLARTGMAYASLVSGITLANAGLGVVHGFASSIGGFFPVPHGVVCGSLLAPATRATIEKLRSTDRNHNALVKYSHAGALLNGTAYATVNDGCEALISILEQWSSALNMPRFGSYGITVNDIDKIVKETGNKNNPVKIDTQELRYILESRM